MKEVFEVKRSKLYYEENGCHCDSIGDVLSFRGIAHGLSYGGYAIPDDSIIGFYNYKSDSFYWFYEVFDGELYLNQINNLNCSSASLDELEAAMNNAIGDGFTFKLTHVAHDYSLVFKRNDM